MQTSKHSYAVTSYSLIIVREFITMQGVSDRSFGHRFIGLAFSSLCNTLVRKEAQCIQLQDIGEPEDDFLNTDRL